MFLALAMGLASVSVSNYLSESWNELPVEIPPAESETPIAVLPQEHPTTFEYIGSGCGGGDVYGGTGSGSGYKTESGQTIGLSSSCFNSKEKAKSILKIRLEEATRIIESSEVFDKISGTKAKRIILEIDQENKVYEILRLGETKCIWTISAPTLKLAQEFEGYHLARIK